MQVAKHYVEDDPLEGVCVLYMCRTKDLGRDASNC